jgi:NarL family two-component system sensor histidine kinase YdfH
MPTKLISPNKVEQDYRLFFAFLTLVMVFMYAMTIKNNTALQQFWPAALFTLLMTAHVVIHLKLSSFIHAVSHEIAYIIVQGVLAFIIAQMSGNVGMLFALYMALIGECIGFLGLTRWAALTIVFYLTLSLVNLFSYTDPGSAIYWFGGTIPMVIFVTLYVALYTRQNEAREKAQALAAELEAANHQLSEYAARVEDLTIAAERQRMARELHDTLSQGLAGLILQLEAVDAHLSSNRPEKAHAIISNAMLQARATLADARHAIDALRQTSEDDLETSVRLEISRFEDATGLPCLFQTEQIACVSDDIKETIIRAVAEGLTNVARHAQARQVTVRLSSADGTLRTEIQDDGQGFDASAIPSGHYGLIGLRERVRLVGGQFTIESASQKGTLLKINIPLSVSAETL